MKEENFLTLSPIPSTFPPNRFPGSFSFRPFLGSTAVSLNLFHQWPHPFHPSSTLLLWREKLKFPVRASRAFLPVFPAYSKSLPLRHQATSQELPSPPYDVPTVGPPHLSFHLSGKICSPAFTKYPSPHRFWLMLFLGEGVPEPSPFQLDATFVVLIAPCTSSLSTACNL